MSLKTFNCERRNHRVDPDTQGSNAQEKTNSHSNADGQAIICYIDLPGYIEVELSTFITDLDIFYHTCYITFPIHGQLCWRHRYYSIYLPGLLCESVGSEQGLPSWCFIILRQRDRETERQRERQRECSWRALMRGTTNRWASWPHLTTKPITTWPPLVTHLSSCLNKGIYFNNTE